MYNRLYISTTCFSKLKKITAFCAAKDGTNIFVGTDSGNIHQVDVSTLRLSSTVICRESIIQQYVVCNSLLLYTLLVVGSGVLNCHYLTWRLQ